MAMKAHKIKEEVQKVHTLVMVRLKEIADDDSLHEEIDCLEQADYHLEGLLDCLPDQEIEREEEEEE